MSKDKLDPTLEAWVVARKRHHLSHGHVQMARELGMNPKKLGGKDNHKQEPWKAPLPEFIQSLYAKQFGRDWPANVKSIEELAKAKAQKKAARKNVSSLWVFPAGYFGFKAAANFNPREIWEKRAQIVKPFPVGAWIAFGVDSSDGQEAWVVKRNQADPVPRQITREYDPKTNASI